jgi:hypothetical protein
MGRLVERVLALARQLEASGSSRPEAEASDDSHRSPARDAAHIAETVATRGQEAPVKPSKAPRSGAVARPASRSAGDHRHCVVITTRQRGTAQAASTSRSKDERDQRAGQPPSATSPLPTDPTPAGASASSAGSSICSATLARHRAGPAKGSSTSLRQPSYGALALRSRGPLSRMRGRANMATA